MTKCTICDREFNQSEGRVPTAKEIAQSYVPPPRGYKNPNDNEAQNIAALVASAIAFTAYGGDGGTSLFWMCNRCWNHYFTESGRRTGTQQQATNSPSTGCFIATACYGFPDSPEVLTLQHFRDRVLLRSRIGVSFVRGYYWISPTLSEFVQHKPKLRRAIVRLVLDPIVHMANKMIGKEKDSQQPVEVRRL